MMQQAMVVGATMWSLKESVKNEKENKKKGNDEKVLTIEKKKQTKDEK